MTLGPDCCGCCGRPQWEFRPTCRTRSESWAGGPRPSPTRPTARPSAGIRERDSPVLFLRNVPADAGPVFRREQETAFRTSGRLFARAPTRSWSGRLSAEGDRRESWRRRSKFRWHGLTQKDRIKRSSLLTLKLITYQALANAYIDTI